MWDSLVAWNQTKKIDASYFVVIAAEYHYNQ